jgi:hypothetical protein
MLALLAGGFAGSLLRYCRGAHSRSARNDKSGRGRPMAFANHERGAWLSNAANAPTAGAIVTGNAPVAAVGPHPGG